MASRTNRSSPKKKLKRPYSSIEEDDGVQLAKKTDSAPRRSKRLVDSSGQRAVAESTASIMPTPPASPSVKPKVPSTHHDQASSNYTHIHTIRKELKKLQTVHNKLIKEKGEIESSLKKMQQQLTSQDAVIATQLIELEALRESHVAHTKSLNCSICLDTMVVPHVVPGCGHTFCFSCLRDWLRRKQECPTCRLTVRHEKPVICLALRDQISASIEAISNIQQQQEALKRLQKAEIEYKTTKHAWMFLAFPPLDPDDAASDSEDDSDFLDIEIVNGLAMNVPDTVEGLDRADELAQTYGFVTCCLYCDRYGRNHDHCLSCGSADLRLLEASDGENEDEDQLNDSDDEASETDESAILVNSTNSEAGPSDEDDADTDGESETEPSVAGRVGFFRGVPTSDDDEAEEQQSSEEDEEAPPIRRRQPSALTPRQSVANVTRRNVRRSGSSSGNSNNRGSVPPSPLRRGTITTATRSRGRR